MKKKIFKKISKKTLNINLQFKHGWRHVVSVTVNYELSLLTYPVELIDVNLTHDR